MYPRTVEVGFHPSRTQAQSQRRHYFIIWREHNLQASHQMVETKQQQKDSDDKDSRRDATWDEWVQRMELAEDETSVGIAIDWADDVALHACQGVAGAPIPQGATAAASGIALRAWFSALVVAVNANSPVMLEGGIRSSEFFDHLLKSEYYVIVQKLTAAPIRPWWTPLNAAGLSAGRFYVVTNEGSFRLTFEPWL